jgi:hypothetical protein
MMYNDDYPTCEETYATLRIYHDDLNPDDVSSRLRLVPSDSQKKGQILQAQREAPVGAWFLSSQDHVPSRDVGRHIVWIIDQLSGREAMLKALQDEGYQIDLFCFWASANGHGGPELTHEIMQRLSSLKLNLGFDVYC